MKKLKKKSLITKREFFEKINNSDGNFRNCIFPFTIDLSDREFNFEFNFYSCYFEENVDISDSCFKKKVWFVNSRFKKNFILKKTIFEDEADFSESLFYRGVGSRKVVFNDNVFFNGTIFKKVVNFSYTRFRSGAFFHKTHFYDLANFSYVFFNREKQISFVAINKNYDFESFPNKVPLFIFRAVDFYENVEFRDINLSRTVFQDSTFEDNIYFKECKFSKKRGRSCFYEEIAKEVSVDIEEKCFKTFLNSKIIFYIVPVVFDNKISKENLWLEEFNLSDKIFFKNDNIEKKKWRKFFILTKIETFDIKKSKEDLKNKYPSYKFNDTFAILDDFLHNLKIKNKKKDLKIRYYIFKLKNYKEVKSWENIEFLSRQMKRNLAAATDWQRSGEFYIGEMKARIKKLKLKKTNFLYRCFLMFYGAISGFGERTWKVVLTMFVSFFGIYWVIEYLKPSMTFYESVKYIVTLFIPIFGDKSFSGLDVQWGNRATIFFIAATFWFYILWFLLILSIQRKFKK